MTQTPEAAAGTAGFGPLLRKLRLAAGLTQEALAEATGLSVRGISDLERGLSHRPQQETMRRFAQALHLDAEELAYLEAMTRGRTPIADLGPGLSGTTLLPIPATPLVGRTEEIASLQSLLAEPAVRLVTLTGPGGVGKTRLALHVAQTLQQRYGDGVQVVSLAPLRAADAVAEAIGRALGLRESPGISWHLQLHAALRGQERLLVLDNFEYLLPAAPLLSDLLAACPRLHILVTSRARLRLSGEHEVVVAPLALPSLLFPPALETLAQTPAVALFLQRARAVDSSFALSSANAGEIAEICVRLDGLPLAIELAAVRIKLLTPHAILSRLDRRLLLLTGGAHDLPARQQSLRRTLDWSYALLDEHVQIWFRRLAVFVGGWSLTAAAGVCARDDDGADEADASTVDVVAVLQDTSLVQRVMDVAGMPRFTMLETVREYAHDLLVAAGERETARRRHASYAVMLAEQAEPAWDSAERASWAEMLETEHENLRTALQWTLRGGDAALGLRLAGALHWFWEMHSHGVEGRFWCEQALALATALRNSAAGLRALYAAGTLARQQGDYGTARTQLDQCIVIASELGEPYMQGLALHRLGVLEMEQGHFQAAQDRLSESISLLRAIGERSTLALALFCLGDTIAPGDAAAARVLYNESEAIARAAGDTLALAGVLTTLGHLEAEEGRLDHARAVQEESLALRRTLADRWGLGIALVALGDILRRQGALAEAAVYVREGIELFRQLDSKDQLAWAWHTLGLIALDGGDVAAAAAALAACLPLRQEQANATRLALTIGTVVALALQVGRDADAARLCAAVAESIHDGAALIALSDRHTWEATLSQIQRRLSTEAVAAAWTAGRRLTLDEAAPLAQKIVLSLCSRTSDTALLPS